MGAPTDDAGGLTDGQTFARYHLCLPERAFNRQHRASVEACVLHLEVRQKMRQEVRREVRREVQQGLRQAVRLILG